MYYRDLETKPVIMAKYNESHKAIAKARLEGPVRKARIERAAAKRAAKKGA